MRSYVISLTASLLAASAASVAQVPAAPVEPQLPPQYEVEVIVFANRDFDPAEELFDQSPNGFGGDEVAALREPPVFDESRRPQAPPLVQTIEPLEPADPFEALRAQALKIRLLGPTELKLGNEYRRLQGIAAYAPLLHAGWVQPGLPEADAEPFDLGVLGLLNPRGTIRVHLSRFLHITLDLTYEPDGASLPAASADDALDELRLAPRYRLTATRSARSGELHYFDHPAFGVLVRVTPVQQTSQDGRRPAA